MESADHNDSGSAARFEVSNSRIICVRAIVVFLFRHFARGEKYPRTCPHLEYLKAGKRAERTGRAGFPRSMPKAVNTGRVWQYSLWGEPMSIWMTMYRSWSFQLMATLGRQNESSGGWGISDTWRSVRCGVTNGFRQVIEAHGYEEIAKSRTSSLSSTTVGSD